MPLLYSDAARKLLKLDVDQVIQKVAFYGEVFIPFDAEEKNLGVIESSCIKGYYMPLSRFEVEDFRSCKFHFPTKSEWVLSIRCL